MTKEEIIMQLDQLKNGEKSELVLNKEEFSLVRPVLVEREDFKYFRGIAQRNGGVTYTYLSEPRS